MSGWMPSPGNALAPAGLRLLRSLAAGSAVVLSVVLPTAVAAADEPAGATVVGRLVQAWAESFPGKAGHADDGQLSWVEPAEGDPVLVDSAGVEGVPSGSTVAVTLGTDGPDGSGDGALPVLDTQVLGHLSSELPAPAPSTNQVTVAMVAPAGSDPAGDGTTLEQVVSAVEDRVAPFWAEQSDGAITLGVTEIHDWTAAAVTCEQPGQLWDDIAARVHFEPGPGKHLLLYVSRGAGCGYALAEVGTAPSSGGRIYVTDTSTSAIAHEFGHNFGLGHSSAEQCDGAVEGGFCRTVAYRDYYDVMGVSWSQTGNLNAAQAALLGLLPEAQQQLLSVKGSAITATLTPLSGRVGTRALRLTDADGIVYWLEYRTATARDGWLASSANRFGLESGVLLRRAGGLPDTSVLLDGTPTAAAGWDGDYRATLPVGVPVTVSGGDFSVVVQGLTPAGAVVSVAPNSPAGGGAPATPAPRIPHGGVVLPGSGEAAAETLTPTVEEAPEVGAPQFSGAVQRVGPDLEPTSEATRGSGALVVGAGALLVGSTLLVARLLWTGALRHH
jgi:hypothetical protein